MADINQSFRSGAHHLAYIQHLTCRSRPQELGRKFKEENEFTLVMSQVSEPQLLPCCEHKDFPLACLFLFI